MRIIKYAFTTAAAAALFLIPAISSHAQISIGVNLGPEPNCPYGYYDYAPYNCSPDGYYGPQWFNGGVFIGAGQWHRGGANFRGDVNNRYDPQHGYKGAMPARGAVASHQGPAANFKGNESRDGHGVAGGRR
jgi:hypothetical protein